MDEVEELVGEFLADANDAFNVNLVRAGKPVFEEPFHPIFTYPIFGEEERVFGYTDLEINLQFRAHDLLPSLGITYEKKFRPIGDTKAMDIKDMIKDYLPENMLAKDEAMAGENSEDGSASSNWTPPGKRIHQYKQHGKQFEIWLTGLTDPVAKEILRRMQIFIPFYIEGGTCQDLEEELWTMARWKLFLLYEVAPAKDGTAPPYIFAGFSTSYRLWVFPTHEVLARVNNCSTAEIEPPEPLPRDPDTLRYSGDYSPMDAPSRERISQFLIIPPYQGQAHGTHLYNKMMDIFLSDKYVVEVTVEDPSEAFDDLRDWCDLARLRSNPEFADLNVADKVPEDALRPNAEVPSDKLLPQNTIEKIYKASRIVPRQFARLVEMHTLSKIPARHRSPARISRKHKAADPNDRRYYFWRHLAKKRLYIHNRDQLIQIEESERVEKVEQALGGVETDYIRLLEGAERRAANGEGASGGSGKKPAKRKKAVIEDEDEDEDEEPEKAKKAKSTK
ncbi:uncharacterized protein K452DRAFT_246383 [Aplosporella prunicola CBS 121167]|uniref:Histone acetyltransferase type B catalytic subunit n=1 Tax=Aplosporella prunicola CBS 121167 TaxID=1176127 RepID=A0A6A6BNN0_9PEZI|nr:uncharacterized protein K452DRAFT_246383 [Aplosporella prunicola CBS 121167]KAF2144161.1 hypothetical protein K452DRAFT_246383 [Aplosporella prunicola CBS 121167]